MTLTLFNAAAVPLILMTQWGLSAAYPEKPSDPDCQAPDCIEIDENKLHSREKKLLNISPSFFAHYFSKPENTKEYLRLRKDDSRDKVLFLSSEFDDAYTDPVKKFPLLKGINQKFDLKFKVVKSHKDICHEINQASKTGKLAHVIIDAAGTAAGLRLAKRPTNEWLNSKNEFLKCFKGLDPSGRIILLGAASGAPLNGNEKESIAQKIATGSKRNVIAPTEPSSAEKVELANIEDFEFFHRSKKSFNLQNFLKFVFHPSKDISAKNNIFKLFYPLYKNCLKAQKNKLHPREQKAIEVIKTSTLAKSILIQPIDNFHTSLEFCKEDPKQKFLYLSMEKDSNGALDPKWNPKLFNTLSKNYDLKFKVVSSFDEICKEFAEAAKAGEFIHVVIDGHGNVEGVHISGFNHLNNYIHKGKDLSKCFKGLNSSGKITVLACNAALPKNGDPEEIFAKNLARATQRTVTAANEDSFLAKVEITSIKPFEISHPSKKDANKNIYKNFKPVDNI